CEPRASSGFPTAESSCFLSLRNRGGRTTSITGPPRRHSVVTEQLRCGGSGACVSSAASEPHTLHNKVRKLFTPCRAHPPPPPPAAGAPPRPPPAGRPSPPAPRPPGSPEAPAA